MAVSHLTLSQLELYAHGVAASAEPLSAALTAEEQARAEFITTVCR